MILEALSECYIILPTQGQVTSLMVQDRGGEEVVNGNVTNRLKCHIIDSMPGGAGGTRGGVLAITRRRYTLAALVNIGDAAFQAPGWARACISRRTPAIPLRTGTRYQMQTARNTCTSAEC